MMAVLKWYGDKAKAIATEAAIRGLQICAADLQGKSAAQAPIDTGDLRANCAVNMDYSDPENPKVDIGYNLPYAIRQHEHTEYRHPKGGKAKYLEDPYNENKSKYEKFIKDTIKKALQRG